MNALTRTAPPFPLNPSTGQRFGQWVWNGAQWVCAPANGVQVLRTVFTASGPYMPSSGLVSVDVECIGGGGGGGAATSTNVLYVVSGGGGGSGGDSKIVLPAALVAGGVQVTIGGGGAGGVDAAGAGNVPAGDGGATTFGALCVANGGTGGKSVSVSGGGGEPGPGGNAGTGDVAFPGAAGFAGELQVFAAATLFAAEGGRGGWIYGGSAAFSVPPGQQINPSPAAPNSGAGGSGACVNQLNGGQVAGAPGGSGICIVTEYCWAFSDDNDCLNPPINVNARVAVTHVPWGGPGPCPPGWGQGPYLESDD